VNPKADSAISIENLIYLPAYAEYLKNERLTAYVQYQVDLSFELDSPLLSQFKKIPQQALIDWTEKAAVNFLNALLDNSIIEYISISLKDWKTNKLPINQDMVLLEDITIGIFIWKKGLLQFITGFTTNADVIIELVKEIDQVLMRMEVALSSTLIKFLQQRIEEHSRKLEKSEALHKQAQEITKLGNYIWDVKSDKIEWSEELYNIYEIPKNKSIDFRYVQTFNHPEDTSIVNLSIEAAIASKEQFDFYYRIITSSGKEKILHAQGKPLTNENGIITEVIGTTQDVTEKQQLLINLLRSEKLYRQAEELATMGTWSWDGEGQMEWTDQLYRIYDLEPQSEQITSKKLFSFIHPLDRAKVVSEINLLPTKKYIDETFRIITAKSILKWVRLIARVYKKENSEGEIIIGTERDVTEKQKLIGQLKQSEELYKQAQALAHVGNWSMDLNTNEISWSDEMNRIYGVQSGTKITLEKWTSFIYPEQREDVIAYLTACMNNKVPYNKVHDIVLENGERKTIHLKGEFLYDSNRSINKLSGTTQDITEIYSKDN
jgi:PAS domain S-box-containing protein